ncbi:histidine kinase, partial [Vibrio sp. 10N.222.55.E8]
TPLCKSMLAASDDMIVSAGIWPEPYSLDSNKLLNSYFFNKADDGKIDQIFSYNNPKNVPYHQESWYIAAANQARGDVEW